MELLAIDRFVSEVNPNLVCPICMCVLNDPVQVSVVEWMGSKDLIMVLNLKI